MRQGGDHIQWIQSSKEEARRRWEEGGGGRRKGEGEGLASAPGRVDGGGRR